jgi:molybdate transport system regulatory protein
MDVRQIGAAGSDGVSREFGSRAWRFRVRPGRAMTPVMAVRGEPKIWLKIVLPGRGELGPGKIALLRAVQETGSISAAARAMKLSYKKAWQLIDALNGMFKTPVVETRIGGSERGGAAVTALGERLIALYGEASQAATSANVRLLAELEKV